MVHTQEIRSANGLCQYTEKNKPTNTGDLTTIAQLLIRSCFFGKISSTLGLL